MIFCLLMENYTRALSSSADKRSSRAWCGAELLPLSRLPADPTLPPQLCRGCSTGALLLHTPVQAILVSIWGPRKYTAGGEVEHHLLIRAKGREVWPRPGTSCHHPGKRHVVPHLQSWQRGSPPRASLRDRIMQQAFRKNKDVALTGPAG